MNLFVDDGKTHRQSEASEEQNSTFVEAVNSLLKLYATDSNMASATLKIAVLRKTSMKTPVQLVYVLRIKVARCGNTYPEERIEKVFIDGLPANRQSGV